MRAGLVVSVLSVTLVALSSAAVQAQSAEQPPSERFHVEFGTVWWRPAPELTIQTATSTAFGVTDFDFADEFGLDTKSFSEIRLVLKPARKHKVRVSYVPVNYEQTSTLRQPIAFDGATFFGSAALNIKWNLWRFGYEWDFISTERGFFGILADVKYNKVSAAVQSRFAAGASKAQAAFPGIGVIGRGYVHRNVAISGELTGFKLVGGSVEGSFLDFDVSATANIFKSFGVLGGYRAVNADYVVDEDIGNLKLSGVYFGIVSRF
jgi:hypothetical protein